MARCRAAGKCRAGYGQAFVVAGADLSPMLSRTDKPGASGICKIADGGDVLIQLHAIAHVADVLAREQHEGTLSDEAMGDVEQANEQCPTYQPVGESLHSSSVSRT